MYRITAIALALFLCPAASEAAPIYLKCELPFLKTEMNVTLNEDVQTVTLLLPKENLASTVPGVFTADNVRFHDFKMVGSPIDYSIDRTNLDLRLSGTRADAAERIANMTIEGADAATIQKAAAAAQFVEHGTCAIVKVKRAF